MPISMDSKIFEKYNTFIFFFFCYQNQTRQLRNLGIATVIASSSQYFTEMPITLHFTGGAILAALGWFLLLLL